MPVAAKYIFHAQMPVLSGAFNEKNYGVIPLSERKSIGVLSYVSLARDIIIIDV